MHIKSVVQQQANVCGRTNGRVSERTRVYLIHFGELGLWFAFAIFIRWLVRAFRYSCWPPNNVTEAKRETDTTPNGFGAPPSQSKYARKIDVGFWPQFSSVGRRIIAGSFYQTNVFNLILPSLPRSSTSPACSIVYIWWCSMPNKMHVTKSHACHAGGPWRLGQKWYPFGFCLHQSGCVEVEKR